MHHTGEVLGEKISQLSHRRDVFHENRRKLRLQTLYILVEKLPRDVFVFVTEGEAMPRLELFFAQSGLQSSWVRNTRIIEKLKVSKKTLKKHGMFFRIAIVVAYVPLWYYHTTPMYT